MDIPSNKARGLRAVVGELVEHVRHYDVPDGDRAYAEFIEQWGDRLLRSTGYHGLRNERDDLINVLARLADDDEVTTMNASAEEELVGRISLAKASLKRISGIDVDEP